MSKTILNKKIAIDFVRRRLWSHGFKVKTMPENSMGFDLMVGSETRLLVTVGKPDSSDAVQSHDAVAFVMRDKISGTNAVYFGMPGKEGFVQNPKEVFVKL